MLQLIGRLGGILEVREAIDFCRYYAVEARKQLGTSTVAGIAPVGCITPWNFPLAIFTGQIVAALVCGNSVLAKPAELTTLIAARAVELMYQAYVLLNEASGSRETQLADPELALVLFDVDKNKKTQYRRLLAAQQGARIALVSSKTGNEMLTIERVVSTDTTASGGNATLLELGDG